MSVFQANMSNLFPKLAFCVGILAVGLFANATAVAQGVDPRLDPTQDPIQEPVQEPTQDPIPAAGGGGGTPDGELEDVEPFQLDKEIPDDRNMGFPGSTAAIVEGFVGENVPEDGFGDGTFGGSGLNRSTQGGLAGGQAGQENGFRIPRRGIRAKLVPSFAAPTLTSQVIQSRFSSRLSRQPVLNQIGQGVTIRVQNKTATISGFVYSAAEARLIERQLRLEPGVYSIINNVRVAQQPAAQFQQGAVEYVPGEVEQVISQPQMIINAPMPPVEGVIEVPVPQNFGR